MNLRIFAPAIFRSKTEAPPVTDIHVSEPAAQDIDLGIAEPGAGYRFLQRSCDIVLSALALLLFALPCLIIAALIKLESPGPVLFKQLRVGQDGNQFWFFKFRSMVADAESQRKALLQMNEASGPIFKIKNDPRITRVGRFIRKYSLDELPQFLNVLAGQMSLVGPRPALPAEVAQYTPRQRGRLSVKPGITGLWQVSGRSDLPFERAIELDLEFIRQQSFRFYLAILLKTVPAVVKGRGAY